MFRKSKPFSDEYTKQHRATNRAGGIFFGAFAALMMLGGVYFDMTSKNIDIDKYFIFGFISLVLSMVSFHRQSQFVENEAIYKAIQARQKEGE